ncbi:MAG TPA: UPF0158 family protein [Williamwhitmania sp.]|nr:UPF0158 family protein [Williamwhitmania sp.]
MLNVSENTKLHIAQVLTLGEVCYYDSQDAEVIAAGELEGKLKDRKRAMRKMEVTQNANRYIKFEPPVEAEKLVMVEVFAKTVRDPKEREHLIYALQRTNPMAYFHHFINTFSDERNAWFIFKKQRYIALVEARLMEV